MIHAVELSIKPSKDETEWQGWYRDQIRALLTVPGFRASQTFRSVLPVSMPYLTLHQIDNPGIVESPEYNALNIDEEMGGESEWHASFRQTLFDGLGQTPDVPTGSHLLVLEDARDVRVPAGISLGWVNGIGAEGGMKYCGLAVVRIVPLPILGAAKVDPRVRVYRPLTEKAWQTP